MRNFDTAIVNVPLAKRGNIDNQIDAYKRDCAAKEKAAYKTRKPQRQALIAEGHDLIDQFHGTYLDHLANKFAKTRKQIMAMLRDQLRTTPELAVKAFRKSLENWKCPMAERGDGCAVPFKGCICGTPE